jgi:hypothetical protein
LGRACSLSAIALQERRLDPLRPELKHFPPVASRAQPARHDDRAHGLCRDQGHSRMGAFVSLTAITAHIAVLLRHADIGVSGAATAENPPDEGTLERYINAAPEDMREQLRKRKWLIPELTHQGVDSSAIALPWNTESAGTQRLFALAGPWLDILNKGLVGCVDELETSMHPLMARELLRLFMCPVANAKGAQLIFTTHNPLLLDTTLIRRDQVWFTDKDDKGVAHLYPLTDYSPRKGESLVRGYLSGRYGAVPFIPAGLLGKNCSTEATPEAVKGEYE